MLGAGQKVEPKAASGGVREIRKHPDVVDVRKHHLRKVRETPRQLGTVTPL